MNSTMVVDYTSLDLRNATSAEQAGLQAIAAGVNTIDLSPLENVDSSAVAVLLAWSRAAAKAQRRLQLKGVPGSLMSLVSLYGLSEFLSLTALPDVVPTPERH